MIISSSYQINSPFSNSGKVPIVKKTLTSEKNKIFIPSKMKDSYTSNSNYNSINYYDRSIIVKKISLSNIFGSGNSNTNTNNNTNNKTEHPTSVSLTEKEVLDDSNYISSNKINLYNNKINLYNNRVKKIKMATLIQSVVRRFLLNKKLFNDIQSVKRAHNTKSKIYRKKIPLNKKNVNNQTSDSYLNNMNEKKN